MGWFKTLLKFGMFAALAALGALVVAVLVAMASLPGFDELKSSPNGQMVRVRAADGSVIVSLGPSYGDWLPTGQIPESMKKAMVAVEDRRFYMHPGIDPIGMVRAGWVAWERKGEGRRLQGASTITQQLARNIFLTNAYSFGRKFREVILALAMERKFSKQQILELYLNRVYFGGGAYGIDAASRKFFDHSAKTLTLGESAIIAGLVKAPSHYSPTADREAAIGRAKVVLDVMQDAGAITPAEAEAVDLGKVRLAPERDQNAVRYFTDWALAQLDELVDERAEPIDVWTTIDPAMQRAADAAIRANAPQGAQGALVALDRDGAVRAMVGGRDYVSSIYNRATQAERQPGSAFKLFVYLAALRAGWTPDSIIEDEPITIADWTPVNNDGVYRGKISLREAFARSANAATVRLSEQVGRGNVIRAARDLGIRSPLPNNPSIALGASGVSLLELTAAYAAIAGGRYPVVARGLPDAPEEGGIAAFFRGASALDRRRDQAPMLDLLYAAANNGTGRRAALWVPTFGKTGTTQENRDALFIGFAGDLVVGVWVGRDDNKSLGKVSGGTVPAQIWRNFMASAISIDGRRGPPLPPEFRIPDRKPEPTKKSPLPEDWSDGTKALRDIGNWIDELVDGKN